MTDEARGISRRDLLRRGAALGGAVLWATPTVQTLGMRPAFAAATSHATSYVAFVLRCGDDTFLVKWEVDGTYGTWESGGSLPCESGRFLEAPYGPFTGGAPVGLPTPSQTAIDGDKVKWTFRFTNGCTVLWWVNKCGQTCITQDYGPDSTVTEVTATPCPAA